VDVRQRVILIGGTSNLGKSTLATALSRRLGWPQRSTDTLARHPGRPWPAELVAARPHVEEHYRTLDVDQLMTSVLTHYRSTIWPLAEALLSERDGPLILEGSALLPELVVPLRLPGVSAIWLTGDDALIAARIHADSGYDEADAAGRALIDKFTARSQAFNTLTIAEVQRLGLAGVAVDETSTVEALADTCLKRMPPPPG
jgi:gluconate kinase